MKCINCNNEGLKPLYPKYCSTNNHICMNCGLVFIPRGDDLSMQDYYKDDGYFKKSPNISLRKEFFSKSMLIKTAKMRLNQMSKVYDYDFNNKKVLDVGCSYGELLYVIKDKYDAEVMGIEPSTETAKIGREVFDIPIEDILLEEFKGKDKYDFIMTNHTLEHVDDPAKFIDLLSSNLKDDGIIYIEVPNIHSPTGNFRLPKFLYNEHLQTFSSSTLYDLIRKQNHYVYLYDDKDFLRFYVSKNPTDIKIHKTNPEETLKFLDHYHSNYSVVNDAKVYGGKFVYLADLIAHKVYDLF